MSPATQGAKTNSGRLYFLDAAHDGLVLSVNPDGSDLKTIVFVCTGVREGVERWVEEEREGEQCNARISETGQ